MFFTVAKLCWWIKITVDYFSKEKSNQVLLNSIMATELIWCYYFFGWVSVALGAQLREPWDAKVKKKHWFSLFFEALGSRKGAKAMVFIAF